MLLQDFFKQKEMKKRKELLEINFGSFGVVVEQDKKIMVYVSQKFVEGKRHINFNWLYDIDHLVSHTEMCDAFEDFSIHYIIDGLTFSDDVYFTFPIFGNICISHCFFEADVDIYNEGANTTLDNNRYCGSLCVYPTSQHFIIDVDSKCTIKNDEMKNCFDDQLFKKLKIYSDEVVIISSNLHVNQAIIISKEMIMKNSKIISEGDISINANRIQANDSLIQSKSGVMIENKYHDFYGKVDSPIYFYNNEDLSPKVVVEKNNARKDFVNVLRQIRDSLNQQNQEKILSFQRELESQKVGKLLIK